MRAVGGIRAAIVAGALTLGACSGGEAPRLMNATSSASGPDEFAILPYRELEIPDNLSELPDPAPGAGNRADPAPEADAVAALGGDSTRLRESGAVPEADDALIARSGRFGRDGNIRETLAAEDLAFRRANDGRLLERIFDVNVYYRAYRPLSLDQQAEFERWRRAGARTPAAPPPPTR